LNDFLIIPFPIYSTFKNDLALWLRHYAISRKVAGSRPDEVNEFSFSIYLFLPAAIGPGVHSASNRNEYQKQKNYVSGEQSAANA
jgi:hypothetical protein